MIRRENFRSEVRDEKTTTKKRKPHSNHHRSPVRKRYRYDFPLPRLGSFKLISDNDRRCRDAYNLNLSGQL